ncbi:MAG: N-acetylmuramoyl-L-alanine amidase [Opitutales bacterium]
MGGHSWQGRGHRGPHFGLLAFVLLALAISSQAAIASPRLSLYESGQYLGLQTAWLEPGKTAQLKNRWVSLVFERNQRAFTVDGLRVHLGDPVGVASGQLTITRTDYARTLLPLLSPKSLGQAPALKHIVIDPGHGGKDAGAINRSLGLFEKELVLEVSLRLAKLLREAGYQVSLTRSDDRFIDLRERPAIANRLGADLFISVHANAFSSPNVRGIETFAYTPHGQPSTGRAKLHSSDQRTYPANRFDAWNLLAAFYLQKGLLQGLGAPDRGVKRARFTVLQSLNCPGVLVELGFISNPSEGAKLKTSQYRDQAARSLARGVLTYATTLQRVGAR